MLLSQFCGDQGELIQCGLQILGDFGGDHVWIGQIGGIFQAIVFQPEDIQTDFVAFDQVFVVEDVESFRFFAVVAVLRVVASDEVVEVGPGQLVGFQSEVLVCAAVIDPQLLRPGFLAGGLAIEEKHVCLYSLRVENAGWQAQQGMNVALVRKAVPGKAKPAREIALKKSKKAPPQTSAKSKLTPRQAKFLQGISELKSQERAALDAGYSPSVARHAHRILEGTNVSAEFQELLCHWVDPDKIGQRIAEGLDAMETIFFRHRGAVTDSVNVIAWSERRAYAEMAAKYAGYYVDKQESVVDPIPNAEAAAQRLDELLPRLSAR